MDFVSSPFLVRESSFNGRKGPLETLRLDLMDLTTSMYADADVVVFNTGHWWTHEKTARGYAVIFSVVVFRFEDIMYDYSASVTSLNLIRK